MIHHTQTSPRRRVPVGLVAIGLAAAGLAHASPAGAFGGLTVDAGLDAALIEGSALQRTIVFSDTVDDGAAGWDYQIVFGDGTSSSGRTATPSIAVDHVYADGPATPQLSVTVSDDGADTATDTAAIVVTNADPTPAYVFSPTTPEGATWQLTLAGVDPGGVADPLLFSVDWGDGTISAQVLLPAGVVSHVFRDGSAAYQVTVAMYDLDGGYALSRLPVTVANVAPTISVTGASSVLVGAAHSVTLGSVVDPGRDTIVSTVVNWGDGTTSAATPGTTLTHAYTTAGTMPVSVDLVDEDGTWLAAGRSTVTVVAPTPGAPSNLTAGARSRSQIALTWANANASTSQTSVQIERCKGAGCTRFSRIATLAGTAVSFNDAKLSSNTTYTYRVRSVNSVGVSPWSNVAAARTLR